MSRHTRTVHAKRNEHIYVRRQRPSRQGSSTGDPLIDIIGFFLIVSLGLWILSAIWPLLLIGGIIYVVGKNWQMLSKQVFIPSLIFTGQVLLFTGIVVKTISLLLWRASGNAWKIGSEKYRLWRASRANKREVGAVENTVNSDSETVKVIEAELLPTGGIFEEDAGEWDLVETKKPERILWR